MTLKKWVPEYRATDEERSILIDGVYIELEGAEPGDHTVLVGGDVLIYGVVDGDGRINIYETSIVASTENHLEQQEDGEVVVLAALNRKAAGLLS
jgi:hypothetical protein